jgi:dTDP-4-amino-4,6-dideoxygalactose transaminase
VLNVKMNHLDRYTEQRQANAARYASLFAEAGLDRVLVLPPDGLNRRHVWNQYVVRVREGKRDALREHLATAKVGSEIYYPLGLHQQECFRYLGYEKGDLPETERAAEEVLALPIFPELTVDQQRFVVEQIGRFYGVAKTTAKPLAHGRSTQPTAR